MSSKAQMNDYIKRLKKSISEKDKEITFLEMKLSRERFIKRSLEADKDKLRRIIAILNMQILKSKKWYQIILRIK